MSTHPSCVLASGGGLGLPAAAMQHRLGVAIGWLAPSITSSSAAWKAILVVLEPTGAETQFVAKLGMHTITRVVRERLAMPAGSTLMLGPDVGAVHLFDENGLRL